MGSVLGALGLAGGQSGSGYNAQQANILNPTTTAQANIAAQGAQGGLNQQQAFVNQLQGAGGQGLAAQQQLIGQLQQQAAGQGPNPAQAQLAQATAANTANQASLMAGQRGASANPGLIARQAAQQGAANQQAAAGQAATLGAQQQLAAQQNLAGLASTAVGQQATGIQNLNAAQQAEQQNILNSIAQQNAANVGMTSNINSTNAGVTSNANNLAGTGIGGLFNGVGVATGLLPAATKTAAPAAAGLAAGGQVGSFAEYLGLALGGKVPALVSPGERYLSPSDAKKAAQGTNPMKLGEKIPGKAKVAGDSPKNDTVKKDLKSGGVVLPRSVTQSKNPGDASKRFVDALNQKKSLSARRGK